MIAKDVLDADIVVNLPKLKTHALTYFTGSVKNTFGYVVGGGKIRAHSQATNPRRFAEILVDIFQVRPPELNIMDAVEAMEGNGPSQGSVRHLGKVLASNNAVSLDAVALHLIGRKVKAVPHLEIAGDRGLGAVDISEISLIGKLTPVTNFKMPATFVPGIVGIVLNRFLSRWINCVPETIKANCKKCGICVNHCPVEAMKMADDFPIADKNKCINCYCCQEMCPEDAIRLTGRVISCIRRS
jgi:ferredoxin